MRKGVDIARSVLIEAGALPETISEAKGIGGHPGGTAAIGRVVDETLQTRFRGLYVCDNSLMPRSGGVPPVLTLIALAKKAVREMWQVGMSSPRPVLTG
jgi:choline dehydrogenase-like flavoprotein